jgi:hypothetical protein
VQNFMTTMNAFNEWMSTKYAIDIEKVPNMDAKQQLFEAMKLVKNEFIDNPNNVELKDLNNLSLNRLTDIYVNKLNLSENRDSNVFGSRPITSNPLPTPVNTVKQKDLQSAFEQVTQTRLQSHESSIPQPSNDEKDDPIPVDVFDTMVAKYQHDKEVLAPPPDNPKALYEVPMNIHATVENLELNTMYDQVLLPNNPITESEQTVIEKSIIRTVTDKYIVINGHDRDWDNNQNRFDFKVNFNNTYTNVSTIQFTKLILPFDWKSNGTSSPHLLQTSSDMKLSVPYITLHVEEIGDQYDGLNNHSRKATTCFIYESSFKCPNGRGFIILYPSQKEIKVYDQSLTSLANLTISIRKPSGVLLSNVTDSYKVIKIEYEYYNQLYIKVVLDKFFDKSEFNICDTVVLKGYEIYMPTQATPGCTTHADFTDVNNYITKDEGHEILQMGEANENGYFKTFYVSAPSKFDANIGKVIVNKCMVDAIKTYNESVTVVTSAKIINTTIQPVIYMTVGVESGKVFRAEPR